MFAELAVDAGCEGFRGIIAPADEETFGSLIGGAGEVVGVHANERSSIGMAVFESAEVSGVNGDDSGFGQVLCSAVAEEAIDHADRLVVTCYVAGDGLDEQVRILHVIVKINASAGFQFDTGVGAAKLLKHLLFFGFLLSGGADVDPAAVIGDDDILERIQFLFCFLEVFLPADSDIRAGSAIGGDQPGFYVEAIRHVEFVVTLVTGALNGSIFSKVEFQVAEQRADIVGEDGQVVVAVLRAVFIIIENASYTEADLGTAIDCGEIFAMPYGAEFALRKDRITEARDDVGGGVLHPVEGSVADVADYQVGILLPLMGDRSRGGRNSGFVGDCEIGEKEGGDDYCIQT